MRVYQGILLVVFLTIGMISAGVAWERFYVSPLVEDVRHKSEIRNSDCDELSPECLEELSTMGHPSRSAQPPAVAKANSGGPSLAGPDTVVRPGNGANQVATHIEVVDSPPSDMASETAYRQIPLAQSADYVEMMAQSAADVRRGRPRAPAPNSADNFPRPNGGRDKLGSADALDMMRRLRADDGDQRAEARRELLRRGFSEVDLELARRLFSPDAETRKQLAREVPRLSSIDAAQWLMWLAQDPETEVRLMAISTLATTTDPRLLDRVEALARNDHDPQIKALADQIRKQHDLEANRGE